MSNAPLAGILVLDFSQYLAGPSAALRLADLGARVIKVERPGTGDSTRAMVLAGRVGTVDGDSLLFHAINRNKESLVVDLKDPDQLDSLRTLVGQADVVIQAFRPGVMERLGFGYEDVRLINDRVVYASVTGYGNDGPWRDKPGQDLLVQARTGLAWLNGSADDPPVPFGLSIVDEIAGAHLCQGILACLVRRAVTGRGGLVEVSLMESALDLQFEGLTTYLTSAELPQRSAVGGAHPYVAAPYGVYRLADGYLAIAMAPVPRLGELLDVPQLTSFTDPSAWHIHRDTIKEFLAEALARRRVADVIELVEGEGLWCAEVLSWSELIHHDAFGAVDMVIEAGDGPRAFVTTRCPIRIDGETLTSNRGAPRLGEHDHLSKWWDVA